MERWSLLCGQGNEPPEQSRALEFSAIQALLSLTLDDFSFPSLFLVSKEKIFLKNLLNLQISFLDIKRVLAIKISITIKIWTSQ